MTHKEQELPLPKTDLAELSSHLGQAWGVTSGESVVQYLAWSQNTGLFRILSTASCTAEEVSTKTVLNPQAADALLCVLASTGIVKRGADGTCALSPLAREYLLEDSPYYIGEALFLKCDKALPSGYLKQTNFENRAAPITLSLEPLRRLKVQHSRNLAPNVAAARLGSFSQFRHIVDLAGGSGVFAIPVAQNNPGLRVSLVELPECVQWTAEIVRSYHLEDRIRLIPMDVFTDEWNFDECDCIYIGNFFHCNDRLSCQSLCNNSFRALPSGGQLWIHEVLLTERRDGPLTAALWNAIMIARNQQAGQLTAPQVFEMFRKSGFKSPQVLPTAANFTLLGAMKP